MGAMEGYIYRPIDYSKVLVHQIIKPEVDLTLRKD